MKDKGIQILIFPVVGLQATLAQNLKMGALFTGISIARSYVLRRLFETNWICRAEKD